MGYPPAKTERSEFNSQARRMPMRRIVVVLDYKRGLKGG